MPVLLGRRFCASQRTKHIRLVRFVCTTCDGMSITRVFCISGHTMMSNLSRCVYVCMAFMAMLHPCAAAARRCTKKSPCFMLGSEAPHGDASSCHRAHLVVAFAGLVLLGLLLAQGHVPGTISHGLHWEREGQGTLVQQPAASSTPATSDIAHPCLFGMWLCSCARVYACFDGTYTHTHLDWLVGHPAVL
jgi:hypothetical protein